MTKLILLIISGLLICNPASASEMTERGSGAVYWKRIFKVYDAQLFAPADATLDNILEESISKCLFITYRVSLNKEKIVEATNIVLEKQHSQATLDTMKDEINLLNENMSSVEKGDSFQLCYEQESTTLSLSFNDVLQYESKSSNFARHYLGIWLAEDQPLSKKLRRSLLD